ncbi:TolC family protein [Pseudomonas songnenensis]|uniref:TolC family protein n=1 Tax=Pseudomonas songnenensis TaxID=1176259 RepID=A0A482UBU7_9PSED|nr:TolC family protein [Pseudomonas songnenensis]
MLRPRACLLLLCLAVVARAEVLPLSVLLEGAEASSSIRAVDAELLALDAMRQQREAEAGWQWFASAGVGHYRELVTDDLRNDYYGRDLVLGLRHPLLGSLHRQLDAVRNVESERLQQQARRELYRLEQRLALRSAYADWWRAQQERQWCRSITGSAEQALSRLAERVRGGWLLASEARLLDARWLALQQKCSGNQLVLAETRFSLQALSGRSIEPQHQASAEALTLSAQPVDSWLQSLEAHPRLQQRREQLRRAEQNRESPWYAGVDSSFSVAQSYEDRNGSSKPGDGLVASINLSTPFDPLGYSRARGGEGEARQQSAQAQLEAEREQMVLALAQALRAQRLAVDELSQARKQLEAAALALHEQRLRRDGEIDQALLGAITAELEHGYAELRLIAAWHSLWLREAALQLFVEETGAASALLGPLEAAWSGLGGTADRSAAAQKDSWHQGVYMWDSRSLLDPKTRKEALQALHGAGMQRIHLGLSADQVAEPTRLRSLLSEALRDAHALGLEVTLLLGDPQWILPEPRPALIELLKILAPLHFDALHLDLEVEQLGWPVPAARLHAWMDTLEEVTQVSPWPLELSSHHRWFAQPAAGEFCVPCRLQQRGVRQVSLMIYTRDPDRSAELAEGIARRWPGLRFRLAQSVEPQLSAQESWKDATRLQLEKQVANWRHRLQVASVTGIDWQDWSYFPH